MLELDVADLAATRFAISPLSETVRAVLLLGGRDTPAVNAPWVRWARSELGRRPLRLPRLWPLIVNGLTTHPEFLAPAPKARTPELETELARLRVTPAAAVRASLHRVWEGHPWPESARELAARPRESLAEIGAEIAEFHDRLIAPHWERIRPVLEADIAYRAGLLAGGGARSLFSDLHPDLRWSGGTLTLTDTDHGPSPFKIMLGPDGVVLMPSVFNWPQVSLNLATSTPDDPDVPGARDRHGMGGRRLGRDDRRARGGGRGPARRAAGAAADRAALSRHHHGAGPPSRRHAERGLPAPGRAAPGRPGGQAAQRASRALPDHGARARPARGRLRLVRGECLVKAVVYSGYGATPC